MRIFLLSIVLVTLCSCERVLSEQDEAKAREFFQQSAQEKVARQVLANGLLELTERVMVLEKREGIVAPQKEEK